MAFLRNHMLLLVVRCAMAILSWTLRAIDHVSFALNYVVQSTLALLPGGKSGYPLILPAPDYHPAVFVTGTSSGIGRDVALALAQKGYTVLAGVRRSEDGTKLCNAFLQFLKPLMAKNVPANGTWYAEQLRRVGRIIPVLLDVTVNGSIEEAAQIVEDHLNRLDIPLAGLINNAGISGSTPMEIVSEAFMESVFAVNYYGPVKLTQRLLPTLRRNQGRVVNVTSIMSWLIGPGYGTYCASKAALHASSMAWRFELANFGVALSVVEPGATRTPIWGKLEQQLANHQRRLQNLGSDPTPLGLDHRPSEADSSTNETISTPSSPPATDQNGADSSTESDGPRGSTVKPTGSLSAPSVATRQLYNPMLQRMQSTQHLVPMLSFPTVHCVDAVTHALTSRFPKITYHVGWDTRILSAAYAIVGDAVIEWAYRAFCFS
ncbi:hypothetical protein H4R34_002741 [Dimargaris verticillata]|uniref:NAD(P)-binding protein n=1 Tax=Dimargaris verticillata TaxID=2761393 RepID=A0A9W8EDT8_9FUNG|nr:hypothetical protein H4R34_002741 [Dimargaris verticillata]